MNLRRLRAFVALAEELHFTRAAARLFVAQQSLSKQISRLEAELGTPLLHRTSRTVELTPAGEVFLTAAREVLARFDQGVAEARRAGRGEQGTLRVGFVVGAALELTTHILAEFTGRHPDARVELHEFGFADPSAGLAGADTDVAFVRLPSSTHGLVVTPLFTEPCVVGVSTAHPMSRRDGVRVAELLDEPIAIGRTDDGVWRDFWTLAGHRAGGRARKLVETHSQSEEVEVVAAGMACGVTPAAARRYSPHPGVRYVPIDDHPGSVVAVARRSGRPNPLVVSFVDAAVTVRDRETEILRTIQGASRTD
ncbi:LysR family transcriptional regulator [Streptomyces sp. NPDC058861]|uniref:LysR family transcriptional regulator n=1 Tax=Streptomyces sp. NPDC058861 TaxID=3346653 RepID=UPI00368089DE